MSEPARSSGKSTAVIVVFVLVALAAVAGNYALDLLRHQGRVEAGRINDGLRSADQSLSDLRAAEASYIAAGQNAEAANGWMNTATTLAAQLETAVDNLNRTTASPDARTHYAAAATLVNAIAANDTKARGLVASGQSMVAGDVVLIDGADTVKQLKAELDAARTSEMAGFERKASQLGWIGVGGNAAVLFVGLMLLLVAARRSGPAAERGLSLSATEAADTTGATNAAGAADMRQPVVDGRARSSDDPWSSPAPDLSTAADLCVDLGLVQESGQLAALMARAAGVLDAKGLVLWVSEPGGGVLRPTFAHGYSERVLQRMGTLPADGDNVTSLAFRTKQPQVVRGSIDGQGALAVPLMTGAGCVGVLAAEVQGAKPGDTRFAVARIIAAQLSTLVAPAVSAETPRSAAQS
jgi:hypothetical protein